MKHFKEKVREIISKTEKGDLWQREAFHQITNGLIDSVKPLVWQKDRPNISKGKLYRCDWQPVNKFYICYCRICNGEMFGSYETLDQAKQACQDHYIDHFKKMIL